MFTFWREFDFYDFCAEIDHQACRLWASKPLGEIEDADTFKDLGWVRHAIPSVSPSP
jgi:hypothetical protein